MMKLNQLLDGICQFSEKEQNPLIKGLCQDSRLLKPGDLFFAYPGVQSDGRKFIKQAVEKGAVAILVELKNFASAIPLLSVPLISIANLSNYLGLIAARFFAYPSSKLDVIGITGTNGKTSCTHFLAQCFQYMGKSCGVIGTLGNGVYGHLKAAQLTTPDAIELQELLANLVEKKIETVFMEVSSHRLAQQRLNGMRIAVAGFSNLTRDHLDYHGSLSAYIEAKRSFFNLPGVEHAVLNADDRYGSIWIKDLAEHVPVIAYSIKNKWFDISVPQIVVKHYVFNQQGLYADIRTPWGQLSIKNAYLLGEFNLSNLLLVLSILKLLGFSLSDIAEAISHIKGVNGRMEVFRSTRYPLVIVDFAHTPDALEQILKTLRHYCSGSLYCVFGCGGDRDKGKRPLMGAVAERYADKLILTNDNPRFENPEQIIRNIRDGLQGTKPVYSESNRRLAIHHAIHDAKKEDIVVIAGKGHENYQLIQGKKYPFSDVAEVKHLLALHRD